MLNVKVHPNPFAEGLAVDAENTTSSMLEKFETSGMSTHYASILKMMSNKPELIHSLLRIKVFQVLANYVSNVVFELSSEALTVFMEILLSENTQVQKEVSKFLNQNKEAMMEIFIELFNQDNYLAKREGMKILHEMLLNKDHNQEFKDYFIDQKEHLKFTMKSLNDESSQIQKEAFDLLLVFLQAPYDKRGDKVNDTLKNNRDPLIQFIEEFMEDNDKEKENDILQEKKRIAIRCLESI